MTVKTPLTKDKLENFVLQHIAAWVEEDGKSFIEDLKPLELKWINLQTHFEINGLTLKRIIISGKNKRGKKWK